MKELKLHSIRPEKLKNCVASDLSKKPFIVCEQPEEFTDYMDFQCDKTTEEDIAWYRDKLSDDLDIVDPIIKSVAYTIDIYLDGGLKN